MKRWQDSTDELLAYNIKNGKKIGRREELAGKIAYKKPPMWAVVDFDLVDDRGLEPLTPTTSMWCSSQLS